MHESPRPYILAETNWETVKQTRYEVAVLPWGATEAHNYHLPYATDNYQVEYVAAHAAGIAWEKGSKPLILPNIPFGINTGQLDIPFCMNMLPSTQLAILKDVCDILTRHGIEKLVILNGHGGNQFTALIRELSFYFPRLFVCVVNWYQAASRKDLIEEPGDHADEMETSVMMFLAPTLVLPLERAGDGSSKKFNLKGFTEGWAWAPRPWTKISKDTGTGNPHKANAGKGEQFINQAIQHIGDFLHEVAGRSVDEMLG